MEHPLQILGYHTFRSFRICIYQTGTEEWDKGFGATYLTAIIKHEWKRLWHVQYKQPFCSQKSITWDLESVVSVLTLRLRKKKTTKIFHTFIQNTETTCLYKLLHFILKLACIKMLIPHFINKKNETQQVGSWQSCAEWGTGRATAPPSPLWHGRDVRNT